MTPELCEGVVYGRLLAAACWHACDSGAVNIRKFQLVDGHNHADYLLRTCRKAVGIIDRKRKEQK